MSIKDRITDDIKEAMRNRDKPKLDTLRQLAAAIKQVEIDERIMVDDARMLVILDKLSKQRHESITQYKAANRLELAEKEQAELDIISLYLPEPLSETEITQLIEQALTLVGASQMSDMAKVMAHLKPQMQGRADMAKVSALIKARLSPRA